MNSFSYEDFECWQEARELMYRIYKCFQEELDNHCESPLVECMIDAVLSMMEKVLGGWSSASTEEFVDYLEKARPLCMRLMAFLQVSADQKEITPEQHAPLKVQCQKTLKCVEDYLATLQKPPDGAADSDPP